MSKPVTCSRTCRQSSGTREANRPDKSTAGHPNTHKSLEQSAGQDSQDTTQILSYQTAGRNSHSRLHPQPNSPRTSKSRQAEVAVKRSATSRNLDGAQKATMNPGRVAKAQAQPNRQTATYTAVAFPRQGIERSRGSKLVLAPGTGAGTDAASSTTQHTADRTHCTPWPPKPTPKQTSNHNPPEESLAHTRCKQTNNAMSIQ